MTDVKIKPVKIKRGAGRITVIERNIINALEFNARVMQQWLISNNRIATGAAVNSFVVKTGRFSSGKIITRAQKRLLSDVEFFTGLPISTAAQRLKKSLNPFDIGWVSGQIVTAPHTKYALAGRGPGKAPPIAEILKWIEVKGVTGAWASRDLAFIIARKIGREGTKGPHFTQNLTSVMVKASTSKMIAKNKEVFASVVGDKWVNALVGVTKFMENIEVIREQGTGKKTFRNRNFGRQ